MCGINGIISKSIPANERRKFILKMNDLLAHRGPDANATFNDEFISLGHTRLSIIDLSPESNQPFYSNDKRYIIVYNGELYNYKQLKLTLQQSVIGSSSQPYFFQTQSDTEVVLAAYMRWGTDCLKYFNGMFAFAVYDSKTQKTFIARDRYGVKPLYYHYSEEGFVFSSEIRAILNSDFKRFTLNKTVLPEYAQFQAISYPNTIVKGIKQLEPGSYIEYDGTKPIVTQYHKLNIQPNQVLTYEETTQKISELLHHAVQQRLEADVPFGAFLSGGIDSSAIVGIMSNISTEPVNTFNISFDESEFSESLYAKLIAKKYNTKHIEIKLHPTDFLKMLPEALNKMDNPGGDGINTYIVSKATKEAGITMAMSGIGGDELFAGYDLFKNLYKLQNKSWLNAFPGFVRKGIGKGLLLKEKSIKNLKLSDVLSLPTINLVNAYHLNRSLFGKSQLNSIAKTELKFPDHLIKSIHPDYLLSAISINEISSYLSNTLLKDTDQMSMTVALEVREPFLDFNLVDFVLNVPDKYKYPTTPKKLLTDSLKNILPDEIIHRKKMGFTLPWKFWLQNELKSFCESNIKELEKKELFQKGKILELWGDFLNNKKTASWSRIWHFVVLNYWIEANKLEIE
jgi:asparagine synthase (glutamine-hydrolysing)